jgi:hypothetical protein
MRNQHRVSLPVLFFIGVLIAPAGFAADKYDVSADEIFDPFGIMTGETIGEFVAEGTVNCPGHEPVLNPALPPCPEGSRTHIRNGVIETRVESDDRTPILRAHYLEHLLSTCLPGAPGQERMKDKGSSTGPPVAGKARSMSEEWDLEGR